MIVKKIVNRTRVTCRMSTFTNHNRSNRILLSEAIVWNDDEGLDEEDSSCGIGLVICVCSDGLGEMGWWEGFELLGEVGSVWNQILKGIN